MSPRSAAAAASVEPPMAMSPSPGSAFRRAISVARSSVAMRVLPTTSVRVDENTTLGSSCQILANSSSSGLNPASAEAVSHTTIVS